MEKILEPFSRDHVATQVADSSNYDDNTDNVIDTSKTEIIEIFSKNYANLFHFFGVKYQINRDTGNFSIEFPFDATARILAFVNYCISKLDKNEYYFANNGYIIINSEEGKTSEIPIINNMPVDNTNISVKDFFSSIVEEIIQYFPELYKNVVQILENEKFAQERGLSAPPTEELTLIDIQQEIRRAHKENIRPLRERISALENDDYLQSVLKSTDKHLEEVATKHIKAIVDAGTLHLQNNQQAVSQALDASVEEITKQLEEQADTMLDSKKRELVETIILEDAMQLWDGKAKAHKWYFAIGAAVFAAAVLVPVFYLLTHWPETVEAVTALTPSGNSFALGNLVVVTIPVLGYAWILRLISRFTLQNMMLSDDASQRSVMAKTFIRLVGHGQADEKHDRAIMLNALFRPLPGASEPDIQPPNLTDFIKGKT